MNASVKSSSIKRSKLKRWLVYVFIVYIICWGSVNIFCNLPAARDAILSKLQSASGVDIQKSGWVLIGPFGSISISHLLFIIQSPKPNTEIAVNSLRVNQLWNEKPSFRFHGLSTPWGTVETGAIEIIGGLSTPRFNIAIDQARIDGKSILALYPESNQSQSEPEMPFPVQSLQIDRLDVDLPWLQKPIRGQVSLNLMENVEKEARVTVFSPFNEGTLRCTLRWDEFPYRISNVKARLNEFAWVDSVYPGRAIVDGEIDVVANPAEYLLSASTTIKNASFSSVSLAGPLTLNASAVLDESLDIRSTDVWFQHQVIRESSMNIEIPPGEIQLAYFQRSPSRQSLRLNLENTVFGTVAIDASGNLFDSAKNVQSVIELNDVPIHPVMKYVPPEWKPPDVQLSGNISAHMEAVSNAFSIQDYQAVFEWRNANVVYPGGEITKANIQGEAAGTGRRHKAELAVEVGGITIPSFNPSLGLTIEPFSVEAEYNQQGHQFEVVTSNITSNYWDELIAELHTGFEYAIHTRTSVEQLVSVYWTNEISSGTNKLSYGGDLEFDIQGNMENVTGKFKSDRISFRYVDSDPYMGIESEDFTGDITIRNWNQISSTIQAATTYGEYMWYVMDLPEEGFEAEIQSDDPMSQYNYQVYLPEEGQITGTYHVEDGMDFVWNNVDMQKIALPFVQNYSPVDIEFLPPVKGRSSGWMKGFDTFKGETTLQIESWRRDEVPALGIQDATIIVPFAYPLMVSEFPRRTIEFQSDIVMWQDNFYSNVDSDFVYYDEAIRVPFPIAVPFFGGEFRAEDVGFYEWKSGYPILRGRIQIQNMELEKVHEIVPYIGEEGTLSLDASELIWIGEQFSLQGKVAWNAFSGEVSIHNVFYEPESRILGMDVGLKNLDLEEFTRVYNYGKLTGTMEGYINGLRIQFPLPGSNELPKPVAFDLKLESKDQTEQIISGETLKKLMELSQSSMGEYEGQMQELYSREFKYSGLGLRGIHNATRTQLYGSLEDDYFIAPSKGLFSNKVGIQIRVAENERQTRNMDFDRVWNMLLAQMAN